MNLFRLDDCPKMSAMMMCDKHIVKMPTETAQLLNTAHIICDDWKHPQQYKLTHTNHPCSLWVRDHPDNYAWAWEHFQALSNEYTHRYGKIHGAWSRLGEILKQPPKNMTYDGLEIPICVGDENMDTCLVVGNPVESYQRYYNLVKAVKMKMTWKNREIPEWFIGKNNKNNP